jgi:hypothetical protein
MLIASASFVTQPWGSASAVTDVRPGGVLLGLARIEPHRGRLHAGQAEAFRMRAQGSGVAGAVRVYLDSGSTAHEVTVGIYSEGQQHPRSLLSQGRASASSTPAWVTVPVAPISLRGGRRYWLAVLGDGGGVQYRGRRMRPCLSDRLPHPQKLPTHWRGGRVRRRQDCPISAYVLAGRPGSGVQPFLTSGSAATVTGGSTGAATGGGGSPRGTSAPVDTELPQVSGVAQQGKWLTASRGSWSGAPTVFAYQWLRCNPRGAACAEINGATGVTYKLAAADVGETIRVAVEASNELAAGEAESLATATIAPAGPAPPADRVLPAISGTPAVGEALAVGNGTWTGSPSSYAYRWLECNGFGEACLTVPGASLSDYTITASALEGTLRAVVTATNAGGSTEAWSAPTGLVTGGSPSRPANTSLPSISGPAVEGRSLTAETGSWTNAPTSFAFQWESCNASGTLCTVISGATAAGFAPTHAEVGRTLRVIVRASNEAGTGKATSPPTATVKAEKESGTPTGCFENPESEGTSRFEACGYPGPHDTGVENCSELPKSSGSKTITSPEKIEDTDITGSLVIEAANVTLNHDCVVFDGGGGNGAAIQLEGSAANFTLSNSTVRAPNSTTSSFEQSVRNDGNAAGGLINSDVLEDCSECLHGRFEATESYILANQRLGEKGLHREDWYLNDSSAVARGDTLLVPENQTAIIFANVANGVEHVEACTNQLTLEDNLMAGSGEMIQTCGPRATEAVDASLTVKGNRFARCLTKPVSEKECSGPAFEGGDSHGYFPEGGWIDLLGEPPWGSTVWEGNFWDDNLAPAAK